MLIREISDPRNIWWWTLDCALHTFMVYCLLTCLMSRGSTCTVRNAVWQKEKPKTKQGSWTLPWSHVIPKPQLIVSLATKTKNVRLSKNIIDLNNFIANCWPHIDCSADPTKTGHMDTMEIWITYQYLFSKSILYKNKIDQLFHKKLLTI